LRPIQRYAGNSSMESTLSRETLPNRKVTIVRSECVLARSHGTFPARLDGGDDLGAAAAPFALIAVIVNPRFLASLALAAHVGFVGLNDTAKQAGIVFHHVTEAVAKEPRRLFDRR
jgi:hypothetical protein